MTFENAIVPTGPATSINSATVSPKDTPNPVERTTKKVATMMAINPSPINTFDVFLWKHNFNDDNAPTNRANIVKYKTYSFIESLIFAITIFYLFMVFN